MKKILLYSGFIILILYSVNLKSQDIKNAHCVEIIDKNSTSNYGNDEFNGEWENFSKICEVTRTLSKDYSYLTTSPLKIKNNKCSFLGNIGKCRSSAKDKIIIKRIDIKFTAKIENEQLHLKTNDKRFKNCEFRFFKKNQNKITKNKFEKKQFCFCIDDKQNVYSNKIIDNKNVCKNDNMESDITEISYDIFLKKKGKKFNEDLKAIDVDIDYIKKNSEVKKWLKGSFSRKLSNILKIPLEDSSILVKNKYVNIKSKYYSSVDIVYKISTQKKLNGFDENTSSKIINNAKNYIDTFRDGQRNLLVPKSIDKQKVLIDLEKSLGRTPSYYEKVCAFSGMRAVKQTRATTSGMRDIGSLRGLPAKTCVTKLIEADIQANIQPPTQEQIEQQIQASQNQDYATNNPTWKYAPGGIGYWDYGNGFGWAPPNPKRDKIIQGLSINSWAKQNLMIGSKGKTIFIPR